jgi:hypothetical protein
MEHPDRESVDAITIRYLELLEYQIFYLLEFKNLEDYLSIIGKHTKHSE